VKARLKGLVPYLLQAEADRERVTWRDVTGCVLWYSGCHCGAERCPLTVLWFSGCD